MKNIKPKLRKLINKKGKLRTWLYLGAVFILAIANGDSIVLVFAGSSIYYLVSTHGADDIVRSVLGITIYLLTSYILLSRKNMLPVIRKRRITA
jgi:hypothetical protein